MSLYLASLSVCCDSSSCRYLSINPFFRATSSSSCEHRALAAADFEIKGGNREGGGRDPHFVLERTLLRVCGEHANNR